MQVYIYMKKQEATLTLKYLNMLKLKHNIKTAGILVYEHYQVKQSKNCD